MMEYLLEVNTDSAKLIWLNPVLELHAGYFFIPLKNFLGLQLCAFSGTKIITLDLGVFLNHANTK